MQIVSSLSPLTLEHEGGTAVAMGYFDGIHIGHRAVIDNFRIHQKQNKISNRK